MVHIGNSWDEILKEEFKKDYFIKLQEFVTEEYQAKVIYPEFGHIFSALMETPYEKVKVVILGQDPYHGPGQANRRVDGKGVHRPAPRPVSAHWPDRTGVPRARSAR